MADPAWGPAAAAVLDGEGPRRVGAVGACNRVDEHHSGPAGAEYLDKGQWGNAAKLEHGQHDLWGEALGVVLLDGHDVATWRCDFHRNVSLRLACVLL